MDFHNKNEFQLFDQSILGRITFGIYDTFSTCQCRKQFAYISPMLAKDFKSEKFMLVKCIFINSSHLKNLFESKHTIQIAYKTVTVILLITQMK